MIDVNDVLIDYTNVAVGVYLVRKNAKKAFQDAKFLYDNNKFQNSIPLFIISIEESLKSQELTIKFRKQQTISYQEWGDLQNHKHKLSFIANFIIDNIESMDEETGKNAAKILGEEHMLEYKDEIAAINRAEKGIQSHFQKLKEFCLYQNWNKEFKHWDEFDNLKSIQKEDLAYYIMKKALIQLHQLDLAIELAIYVIRRDRFMIKDLEFPTYNELRTPKEFETKKNKHGIINDFLKYHRGLRIFESLMVKKAFAVIDQIITNEIIKKCLKLPPINDLENWYPHPVVKSIFNAMAGMEEAGEDGTFAGISGDADLTKSGEPMMYTVSIISKKDGIIKIEKIMINGDEYEPNDKIIEQIMKTETIIDAKPGKEISLEKMHQSFAKIGIKIRKLRDNEIEPAIKMAISMISEGKIIGLPDGILEKIKLVTKQNWDDQDPELRMNIGMCFSRFISRNEDTLIMTGQYDPLEKFKVRGMIYHTLTIRNNIGMSTDI